MSMLVPCSSCRRHVRRMEGVCPFCAAPLAGGAELPLARSVAARGIKRATLFAMGVSVAASACEADNAVAIYGAPVSPMAGAGGGAGRDNAGGSAGRGGAGTGGSTAGTGGTGTDEPADASAPRDADVGDADVDADPGDASP